MLPAQRHGFLSDGRPSHWTLALVSAGDSHLANAPFVEKTGFTSNGALRMTNTKSSDFLNRRTRIASAPSATSTCTFKPDLFGASHATISVTITNTPPPGSKLKLDFVYDWQGRRIQKLVSTNNGSIYVAQSTNRIVVDGWNVFAILNPQSSILQSFTWGLDLSCSLQGAGGVGGLLWTTEYSGGSVVNAHFAAYDGNGNVAGLTRASDGAETARYEYGPFGEPLRQTGTFAKSNPLRFSTKFTDNESGMLYYGYRSYNPSTGRWLNRDPLEEQGGVNLYGFVYNNPVIMVDSDGRALIGWPVLPPPGYAPSLPPAGVNLLL